METRSIIFVYIIDVWTLDPSSFDILLMYGHSIHYFLCIIDVWTLDPFPFELQTVAIVCLNTVLSLRVRVAILCVGTT